MTKYKIRYTPEALRDMEAVAIFAFRNTACIQRTFYRVLRSYYEIMFPLCFLDQPVIYNLPYV